MIKLSQARLPATTSARLNEWQCEVLQVGDYAAQVVAAREMFSRRSRQVAFNDVRHALERMCCGPRRCAYCEDSVGDEVEHIKPKDLYPEQVFLWRNFLYVCGQCNGGKNNQFAIFTRAGIFKDVSRRRHDPVIPPENGEPVLINPRREDVSQWIQLDLRTFFFVPITMLDPKELVRAKYTIDVLRLNARAHLVRARKNAYGNYRARLREYILKRDMAASQAMLNRLRAGLRREGHPTVWFEMKRQRQFVYELSELFAQAPEALQW